MQTQTTKAPVIVHCPCCRYGCTAPSCEAAYQAIAAHIETRHLTFGQAIAAYGFNAAVRLLRPMSGRVQ